MSREASPPDPSRIMNRDLVTHPRGTHCRAPLLAPHCPTPAPRGLTPGQKRPPGLLRMPRWATPAVRRPLLHEALPLALTSWPFLPEGVQTAREAGCPKGVTSTGFGGRNSSLHTCPVPTSQLLLGRVTSTLPAFGALSAQGS